MRPGGGRRRERRRRRDEDESSPPAKPHASDRLPERSATTPSTTPIAPSTSATIASVELPPPPIELTLSIVGDGVSELSEPVPVDDLAVRVRLPDAERVRLGRVGLREELEEGVLAGRHRAAGPGHLLDHGVLARAGRLRPRASSRATGTNESIEKPVGGVSSIFVVVEFSSSVGTARLKTWPVFASTTGGLTCAWADAAAAIDERGGSGDEADGDEPPPRAMAVHSMSSFLRWNYRPRAGNGPEVHLGGARGRSEERAADETRGPAGRQGREQRRRADRQRGGEPGERPPEPGEHVLARGDERPRRGTRARAGPAPRRACTGPTRQCSPCQPRPGAPVDRRLEERERERRRAPERERADGEPRRARSRGRSSTGRVSSSALLADRERRERDDRRADQRTRARARPRRRRAAAARRPAAGARARAGSAQSW